MRTPAAAAGSVLFFAIAPGVVAGAVPWWLTGWQVRGPLAHWAPARITGLIMLILGALVLVQAFARFAAEGRGTPAPAAPAERLVIGGLYRYVRNPMYLAVVAAILPDARVEQIRGSRTWVMRDRPERTAQLIGDLARRAAAQPAA